MCLLLVALSTTSRLNGEQLQWNELQTIEQEALLLQRNRATRYVS